MRERQRDRKRERGGRLASEGMGECVRPSDRENEIEWRDRG